MRLLIPLLVCSLAAPAFAGTQTFNSEQRKAAEAAVTAARDEFDLSLFDYTSARFRDVKASTWNENFSIRLCGLMNAKNRNGAYVGWKPFVFSGGFLITDDPAKIEGLCADSDQRTTDTKDYSQDLTHS